MLARRGRTCALRPSAWSPSARCRPRPLAHALGFQPLPGLFYLALTLMVASYLVLIEIGKRWFYRTVPPVPASRSRTPYHRLLRRAARFTTASPARLPRPVPRQ